MRNQVGRMARMVARRTGAIRNISPAFGHSALEESFGNRNFASAGEATLHRFQGKVALVTGGSSGIGEATVRKFVREGAQVVIADVQDSPGRKLAEELGPATQFVHTDVTKEEDVAAAVDAAVALGGCLDIMVNNAGIIGAIGAIDSLDMAEYDYTVAVNLRGMVMGVKHAARVMKVAEKGSIVCLGSVASVQAGRGPHAYTVSKTGLVGLVTSAAFELRKHGVRVNLVSPDAVPTVLSANALATLAAEPVAMSVDKMAQFLASRTAIKDHFLTPDVVADAIAFLAGDQSHYITGHNLLVDGGLTTCQDSNQVDGWLKDRIPIMREAGIRGL